MEITTLCNKRCSFCYMLAELGTVSTAVADIDRVLADARAMDVEHVVFSGGEAILHPNLDAVLDCAVSHGYRPGLLTNGIGLTERRLTLLRDRASFIQFSLHSLPEDDPEARRVVAQLEQLSAEGLPVTVLTMVGSHNLARLRPLLDLVRRLGVPAGIQRFCRPAVRRAGANMSAEYDMEVHAFVEACTIVWQALADNPLLNCEDPLLNRFLAADYVSLLAQHGGAGCVAGLSAALLAVDGSLYPCAKLRISDTNAFRDGLETAWRQSAILDVLRGGPKDGPCAVCGYFGVCRGCRADAINRGAGLWGADPLCPGPIA
jgi:radical SAM protein with 4Fe4S-binding SPASM domain